MNRADRFRFTDEMPMIAEGPCLWCRHLIPGHNPARCSAFPAGIPKKIIEGQTLHLVPLRGQGNAIVFEREPTLRIHPQQVAEWRRRGLRFAGEEFCE